MLGCSSDNGKCDHLHVIQQLIRSKENQGPKQTENDGRVSILLQIRDDPTFMICSKQQLLDKIALGPRRSPVDLQQQTVPPLHRPSSMTISVGERRDLALTTHAGEVVSLMMICAEAVAEACRLFFGLIILGT